MSKQDPRLHSLESAYRIGYLLAGYVRNALTEEEAKELDDWRQANESNERLFREYTDPGNIENYLQEYAEGDTGQYLEKSKAGIRQIRLLNRNRLWWRIAASVTGIAVVTALFLFAGRQKKDAALADTGIGKAETLAILKMEGNQEISIRTGLDTVFATGMHLKLVNDELIYEGGVTGTHVLTTPARGFLKMTLPDGSRLLVNANSSVRYSPAFSQSERRIHLEGEAYFEVAHDKKRPFRVECTGGVVEALGTAFNINAYKNGMDFTTTLTEGTVKISAGDQQAILKPGEKAIVKGQRLIKSTANTEEATAWSKNEFRFQETPLTDIMTTLSAWYGVEVEYKNIPDKRFTFSISRDSSLTQILSFLQKTEEVNFDVKGEKITVTH